MKQSTCSVSEQELNVCGKYQRNSLFEKLFVAVGRVYFEKGRQYSPSGYLFQDWRNYTVYRSACQLK
jgi:hypothetical protein